MFNRIILITLATLTLSHASNEFSSERLLGIEVGYSNLNINKNSIKTSTNSSEFGLKIGSQNRDWRTTIAGNFFTKEGHKYQKVMLEFDHFVWSTLYKTGNILFKPYLGGHIGWMKYTDNFSLSDNGMVYGGQAGLAWSLLNEVDFDLGYRYSLTNINEVDSINSVIFGVNYIY